MVGSPSESQGPSSTSQRDAAAGVFTDFGGSRLLDFLLFPGLFPSHWVRGPLNHGVNSPRLLFEDVEVLGVIDLGVGNAKSDQLGANGVDSIHGLVLNRIECVLPDLELVLPVLGLKLPSLPPPKGEPGKQCG